MTDVHGVYKPTAAADHPPLSSYKVDQIVELEMGLGYERWEQGTVVGAGVTAVTVKQGSHFETVTDPSTIRPTVVEAVVAPGEVKWEQGLIVTRGWLERIRQCARHAQLVTNHEDALEEIVTAVDVILPPEPLTPRQATLSTLQRLYGSLEIPEFQEDAATEVMNAIRDAGWKLVRDDS